VSRLRVYGDGMATIYQVGHRIQTGVVMNCRESGGDQCRGPGASDLELARIDRRALSGSSEHVARSWYRRRSNRTFMPTLTLMQ
jgi:hypothetical protein